MKIILFWFIFLPQTHTAFLQRTELILCWSIYVPNALGQRHHHMLMTVFCLEVRVVLMCAWINTASSCWPFSGIWHLSESRKIQRKQKKVSPLYAFDDLGAGPRGRKRHPMHILFFFPLYKSISSDQHLTAALGVHGFSMAENWMSGEAWQEQVKGLLTFPELRAALWRVSKRSSCCAT